MTTYSMMKAGQKWQAKKGSHSAAVIQSLKALGGKATGKQIADHVEETFDRGPCCRCFRWPRPR